MKNLNFIINMVLFMNIIKKLPNDIKKKIYIEYIIPQQIADNIEECLNSEECHNLNIIALKPLISKIINNNGIIIKQNIFNYLSNRDPDFIQTINYHTNGNKIFVLMTWLESFCLSLIMYKYK